MMDNFSVFPGNSRHQPPTPDQVYFRMMQDVMQFGDDEKDRTGVGVRSLFGHQARYDISEHLPLLTTKRIFWRGVVKELFWIMRGQTNIKVLQEDGVHFWDEWGTESACGFYGRPEGEMGPIYGHQLRNFGAPTLDVDEDYADNRQPDEQTAYGYTPLGADQLQAIVQQIKQHSNSRRLVISYWNPREIEDVTLPPCHTLFQFRVHQGKELSCHLYQRSGDLFLGVPFNMAFYATLTYMLAAMANLKPRWLVHSFGCLDIYHNHMDAVRSQMARVEKKIRPTLEFARVPDEIDDWKPEYLKLKNYQPHPRIGAPIAV